MSQPAFTWTEEWARIPDTPSGRANGRTHGVTVANDGSVIVFHQAVNGLLTFDPAGRLISAVGGDRWTGAHGLTRIVENGRELLWLVDQNSAEVSKTTLGGDVLLTLPKPGHPAYTGASPKRYIPTWAAQHPVTGEIWVADGYGAHLVHRYDKEGRWRDTLGEDRFHEPHGIDFTTRDGRVELFITSRSDHRIVVCDGEGVPLRESKVAHSPCMFDFRDGRVLVPELFTGVKILDAGTLELIAEVGKSAVVGPNPDGGWWPPVAPGGWPDLKGTPHVRPGVFNSPHGGCFGPDGSCYVVEWIVGGRITRLTPAG